MVVMPKSSKNTKTKPDGTRNPKKGTKDTAGDKRVSAEKTSRFAGLFGAPARILGPRLLFIASVVVLCILGLVMVYSASSITAYDEFGDASYFFDRQVVFLALGVVVCIVLAFVPYSFWGHPPVFIALWLVACAMLALTAFGGGVSALGAERSILIAGFNLQPAEFAKIAVLMTVASLLSMLRGGQLETKTAIVFVIVAAAVPIFLIYRQPDLGTVIILFIGLLSLLILSGFPWKVVAGIVGVLVVYVVVVCIVQPYHIDRIVAMFDPWLDPQGDGYQSIQSFYAFGSGGLFGTGLGLSRQKYLYLPEAHTDFIFSIIGEELGLVGTLFTVALFAVFVFSGMRICRTAPDVLGCLFSGGLTVMIGFQACVNMAQACGIAPVTGKALPFLSYGGSSLVATLMMVGIILSVSRCSRIGIAHERRRDDLVVLDGKRDRRAGAEKAAGGQGAHAGTVISLWDRVRPNNERHQDQRVLPHGGKRPVRDGEKERSNQKTRSGQKSREMSRRAGDDVPRGRLEYPSQARSRGYASRNRRVRGQGEADADQPHTGRSGDTRSSRFRSSTKPANPSGTNRRNR